MTTPHFHALSPRQLREAVRAASYPNSETERKAIATADKAADEVVHRHTMLLREESNERMEHGAALLRVADELNSTMIHDVRAHLDSGGNPKELAATYERVEHGVKDMIASLRHEADKAELLADRLDSPEDDYERLLTRFPALRQGFRF